MWNELQDWMRKLRRRPPRRQAASSRSRGRFESLEARSMLSASYADMESYGAVVSYEPIESLRSNFRLEQRPAMHVVAIVMVSEVPPPLAVRNFAHTLSAEGNAPWENLSWRGPNPESTGPLSILGKNWDQPLAIKAQAPDAANGSVVNDPGATNVGGVLGGGSVTTGLTDKLKSGGGSQFANFLADTNRGQTFLSIAGGREHYQPPFLPPASMANYLSAVSSGATTDDALASPLVQTASLRDAGFDDSSDNSLLLASDQATSGEARERDDLGNEPEADARKSNDDNDHSLFDETTAVALNALARERRAIEAVLHALNEIAMPDDKTSPPESSTYQHRDSPRELALEDWRLDFGHTAAAAPAYDTEGGMVLLENSGDANSNAYDLTAVIVADLDRLDATSTVVEAALGLHQAIDVGGVELGGTALGERPVARPSAAAPASVSAESAPVKKSEHST